MADSKPILCCISGGGMPHIENAIGTIKAIYAHDCCKFDEMWGTSAGALVSIMNMSYEQDIGKLEHVIKTTDLNKWFKVCPIQAMKSIFGCSNYVADNTGLKEFLLNNVTRDAIKKVKCAVTEMPGGYVGKSIICDGQPRHILASMSFQHIFPPVKWDGMLHGDGGVNNNCPIPKVADLDKYEHIYIILAAETPLFPAIKSWPFLNKVLNLIDNTMNREFAQLRELGIAELPNVTVFQPKQWVPSASFLKWSENFSQIDASYNYALDVLEGKE